MASGITIGFRRFGLLLWKNLILRKRHYIITAFEIILPTLFAVLMAYIRTLVDFSADAYVPVEPDADGNTGFPIFTEQEMIQRFIPSWNCVYQNCTIAYAPNTNDSINNVMNKLVERINVTFADDFYEGRTVHLAGFATEREVELFQQEIQMPSFEAGRPYFLGAIIFLGGNDLVTTAGKIAYKIRLGDTFNTMNTDKVFPTFQLPGPNFENWVMYMQNGFSGLQVLLDKAIISVATDGDESVFNYTITSQGMPHPKYPALDFNQIYQIILPQLIVFGFIFIVPAIIRPTVSEKESGIKELMKMMGLSNSMYWISWLLNSLLAQVISVTVIVVLYFVQFKAETGAVLIYSDPTLWWVILMLFTISATCFCFFVSAFFKQATLATIVGIVLWQVLHQPINLVVKYEEITLGEKIGLCLLPFMGIQYALFVMCGFEAKGEGAKWSNFATSLSSSDTFTLGHAVLMIIINSAIYFVLAIYIENIMPNKYGARKPWYYIFQLSTWYTRKSTDDADGTLTSAGSIRYKQREDNGFEKEPTELSVGLDIRGLRKVFSGGKVAVDNVTCKMYQGQITALLGHNGAGKTTTMSMITGLYAPTKGTALVNGFDISKHINKVRENLGLCPQHNMLFNRLTVAEHLMFFGMLKGATAAAARAEMKMLLRQMQFEEKKNVLAMSLSGGQKRKLSLGCALIGGSQIVILDEPTSGMDPEARRHIWDLLLEIRGQRTIVLSTHFMEEADVLGDRIAIMSDGKLQCYGSPMFLKQFYGAGYTLKLTLAKLAPPNLPELILSTVQRHIPQAYLKTQNQFNTKEISIVLPTNNTKSAVFVPLFQDLDCVEIKRDVETMGLSLTTMDEVVGEMHHGSNGDGDRATDSPTLNSSSSEEGLEELGSQDQLHTSKTTGPALTVQQFWALLLKRILFTSRKWRYFISQFLIPVIVVMLAIIISNIPYSAPKTSPPKTMSFADYRHPMTMHISNENSPFPLQTAYTQLASAYGSTPIQASTSLGNITQSLLEVGYDDLGAFRERYIVAAEVSSNSINSIFSTIPFHAAPLAINLASNTLLSYLNPAESLQIEVTNHPLNNNFYELIRPLIPDPAFAQQVAQLFSIFVPIGLAILSATYVMAPVDEKRCKAKQLQLMTGVNPIVYWLSSFIWDYFMMCIVICLMCACFPIFQKDQVYTNNSGVAVVFLYLAIFGFGAISFSYLFSLWVNSVPCGFVLVLVVHVITSFLNFVVDALQGNQKPTPKTIRNIIRWVSRIFPAYGASVCSYKFSLISAQNNVCNLATDELLDLVCRRNGSYLGTIVQACCDNCVELGAPCFEPAPFIVWKDSAGEPGIGQELTYMLIMAFVYKILLLSIELGIFTKIKRKLFKATELSFQLRSEDEDVRREYDRIQNFELTLKQSAAGSNNRTIPLENDDALVVSNMCKSYGTFSAVSKLSFGVHQGECFGLLGVNGAGKTTTFRMLTGDEVCSDGNAYLAAGGNSHQPVKYFMQDSDRKIFLRNIGYCPQFDGLVSVLTGREMLQLFCRLRGIPTTRIDIHANKWLAKLGLSDAATVQCQKYSGGMKRRLSAAMAMVGDPPILFLDEPTSGVDPVARRQFWNVINSIRSTGQAIVLTSHSMEECEVLCNRLGIMVNGEFQCLGGVQHLKNKYAQGYSLTIKLRPIQAPSAAAGGHSAANNAAGDLGLANEMANEIIHRFMPCALKDQHQNILQFQISNTEIYWANLFQIMESIKDKYNSIVEDYSVNGTTLEEVFLSFARKQYVATREANVPLWKKVLTCQCCS